jgi:hypothetical protein
MLRNHGNYDLKTQQHLCCKESLTYITIAKGRLLLVARVPDHSDYPVFPPAPEVEEGPLTPNVIAPPDNAEEILQDLASNLERIFQNEGRVKQQGLPMKNFVDNVLWHKGIYPFSSGYG